MKIFKRILFSFLIAILILVGIFFYTIRGEPKVTIDYVAEYNKISKPENFEPNQNAAELYKEAVKNFVQMPRVLTYLQTEWPTDFNSNDKAFFDKWLTANENAIQMFRVASLKPYFWTELYSRDGLTSSNSPEWVYSIYDLSKALLWDGKIKALNSNHSESFEDILACYRFGLQQCSSQCFMLSLSHCIGLQAESMRTAALIIKKTPVPNETLSNFQQELEKLSNGNSYVFDFTAEKMLLYDVIQRTYVYKPDESGLLAWKRKSDYYTLCGDGPWPLIKSIFVGPTQKEVKKEIDSYYDQLTAAYVLTPWQLHQEKPDFFDKLFLGCQRGTLVLYVYGSDFQRIHLDYNKLQAQLKGLITTISVLKFKNDNRQLPENLDKLIETGYLKELPGDPYSNKPLVYNADDKNFKIYSVGQNFIDDGGKERTDDIVFWPPRERPIHSDPNQPMQKLSE